MTEAADLRFEDIVVGNQAVFYCRLTEQDVKHFAALSGDFNPLHCDEAYATTTIFGQCIVHGMLLASLFSRLVGMYLPGRRCLYLSQSLDFVQPVYINDSLRVEGEVQSKHEATRTLVLRTTIFCEPDRLVVRGKAHVKVIE